MMNGLGNPAPESMGEAAAAPRPQRPAWRGEEFHAGI